MGLESVVFALRTRGPHGIGLYAIVLFTRLIKRNKNKKRGMQQWYLHSGLLNFHLVWIRVPHVIGLYAIVLFTRLIKRNKNKKRGMQQWYLHSGLLNIHLVWIRGPHVIGLY